MAPGEVDPRIRPPLGGSAIVVCSRRTHRRVDRRLQSGATLSVELAVDTKHAVEGLAQMQEAALVLFVGVEENFIRLQAVTKHGGRASQASRVDLRSQLDQDATGDALEGDLVIGHCLRGHSGEVLAREPIEDGIDLLKSPLGGPTPPHPTIRTHVCSVTNVCSGVKQIYRQIAPTTARAAP